MTIETPMLKCQNPLMSYVWCLSCHFDFFSLIFGFRLGFVAWDLGFSLQRLLRHCHASNDRWRYHYEHSRGTLRSCSPRRTISRLGSWWRRNGEIASSGSASHVMTKEGITASEMQSTALGDTTTRCSSPAKLSILMTGPMNWYLCTIISRQKRQNPLPFVLFMEIFKYC